MDPLVLVCPSESRLSADSLAYVMSMEGWLQTSQWRIASSSDRQCIAFSKILCGYLQVPLRVDRSWDSRHLAALADPRCEPDVEYFGDWHGEENEETFIARVAAVWNYATQQTEFSLLAVVTQSVMAKATSESDIFIYKVQTGIQQTYEQFSSSASLRVYEFILLAVPKETVDLDKLVKAVCAQPFIDSNVKCISSSEPQCVKVLSAISNTLACEATVDYIWKEYHSEALTEPKRVNGISYAETTWVEQETREEYQRRLNDCFQCLLTEFQQLVILSPDIFESLSRGGKEGIALMSYDEERNLLRPIYKSEAELMHCEAVLLICASDIDEPADRVIVSVLSEESIGKIDWEVISCGDTKCVEYALGCAQVLQQKLTVDYLWDEQHNRMNSIEPQKREEVNYATAWANSESEDEYKQRTNRLLHSNFSPKIVCVTRKVMNLLTSSNNLSLAHISLDANQQPTLSFHVTVSDLPKLCRDRCRVYLSPEETYLENVSKDIVEKVAEAMEAGPQQLVPLATVLDTLREVLPVTLEPHIAQIVAKYTSAIQEASKKITQAAEDCKRDLRNKVNEVVERLEAIETKMSALQEASENGARGGREQSLARLHNQLREVQENFSKLYSEMPRRQWPLTIMDISVAGILTSSNSELFTVENAELVLRRPNGAQGVLVRELQLQPGQRENPLLLPEDVLGECSVVWIQGSRDLSEPYNFTVEVEKTSPEGDVSVSGTRSFRSRSSRLPIVDISAEEKEHLCRIERLNNGLLPQEKRTRLFKLLRSPQTAHLSDQELLSRL